ncbi:hypothetical protein [uncultured Megasphaera sp.]|uniref:hypothetical protein n=1 Tax=uncultured Megasphaera sp. TaxID=165188 RepID=UPI00261E1B0A|nr:hypothetical protein [uncultured Megasphaera sp.]
MELEHFSERMQRILLMAPLYRLGRRRFKDVHGQERSGMELGLMTLLFFFEQMLDGKKDAGIRNLSAFLADQTGGSLFDDAREYEQLARDIVAVFRPPTGKRNEEVFFDWDQGKDVRARYSYLKADRADIHLNEQYYVLDEQGLELIFATKEYFNEYQLSINQLILRKQLEKGQFVLALRQIEEMRLDVETLRSRMARIRQEIHRNIVSEETLARYRNIVDDLNQRLKSEEDAFKELKDFVAKTKERIRNNADKDPERRAYDHILEVERRLEYVHSLHRSLLKAGIDLGTSALEAAEESLYFTGIDSFNYEQEITSRLFSSPLPVTAARRLVEPFLELQQCRVWSLLDIFMPQRLERLERESRQEDFPDVDDTEVSGEKLVNIQSHYAAIVQALLAFLHGRTVTTLEAFCAYLEEAAPDLCRSKQFYIFWMLIHRRHVLTLSEDLAGTESVYAAIPETCPQVESLEAVEIEGTVDILDYTISNMEIEVTVHAG